MNAEQNPSQSKRQICDCPMCARGLPARYCIAPRDLSPAEAERVEEILARRQSKEPE